jgi:hypothetical protein
MSLLPDDDERRRQSGRRKYSGEGCGGDSGGEIENLVINVNNQQADRNVRPFCFYAPLQAAASERAFSARLVFDSLRGYNALTEKLLSLFPKSILFSYKGFA